MGDSRTDANWIFGGTVQFLASVGFAEGVTFVDANIAPGAGIQSSKLDHRHHVAYSQPDGVAVATENRTVYRARAAGELLSLAAAVTGLAATGNSTVAVNIEKSTAGGAFVSMLTAAVLISSTTLLRTNVLGVPAASPANTYVAGDLIRFTVLSTVGTGTLPQGLAVTAHLDENATA